MQIVVVTWLLRKVDLQDQGWSSLIFCYLQSVKCSSDSHVYLPFSSAHSSCCQKTNTSIYEKNKRIIIFTGFDMCPDAFVLLIYNLLPENRREKSCKPNKSNTNSYIHGKEVALWERFKQNSDDYYLNYYCFIIKLLVYLKKKSTIRGCTICVPDR